MLKVCCMLGIVAMKNAVLGGSVPDRAEFSGILDLSLKKDAFAMEPWLGPSKDVNGRHILSKLRMGSQISCSYGSTYFFFYLPYLLSSHEKVNCIAIFSTGRPQSFGSCLFQGVWATCLPHKGGGVPLSALPKDTTSELAGLFSTTSLKCRAPSREAVDTIFKVFRYHSTRGMNPKSTDCEAEALTTTPSRRLRINAYQRTVCAQCD